MWLEREVPRKKAAIESPSLSRYASQGYVELPLNASDDTLIQAAVSLRSALDSFHGSKNALVVPIGLAASMLEHVNIEGVMELGLGRARLPLYFLEAEKARFLMLVDDYCPVSGELQTKDTVTPTRVLHIAGVASFLFVTEVHGLPSSSEEAVFALKDRMMWNMQNALIGKNFEKLGPRFPDISDQNNGEMKRLFKKVWQQSGGRGLKQLNVLWKNGSKPYAGRCEEAVLKACGCQGWATSPFNHLTALAHCGAKAMMLGVSKTGGGDLSQLWSGAVPGLFHKLA